MKGNIYDMRACRERETTRIVNDQTQHSFTVPSNKEDVACVLARGDISEDKSAQELVDSIPRSQVKDDVRQVWPGVFDKNGYGNVERSLRVGIRLHSSS